MADMKFSHICNFDSLALVNYPVQGYNNWNVFDDVMFNGTTGDKGVYSNVFEMFLLDRALRGSYILHKNTKDEMWTPQTVTSSDGYYALGWRVRWIDNQKWVFHNGWWKGFRTMFIRKLDTRHTIIALNNSENMNPYGFNSSFIFPTSIYDEFSATALSSVIRNIS
jgi:CubicO group peptidase (beta-lactamase class C family)